jgi:hypothetical protein
MCDDNEFVRNEYVKNIEESVANNLLDDIYKLQYALAMMWFAYVNKDADCPHYFEIRAVEYAKQLLGTWEECMGKYLEGK